MDLVQREEDSVIIQWIKLLWKVKIMDYTMIVRVKSVTTAVAVMIWYDIINMFSEIIFHFTHFNVSPPEENVLHFTFYSYLKSNYLHEKNRLTFLT